MRNSCFRHVSNLSKSSCLHLTNFRLGFRAAADGQTLSVRPLNQEMKSLACICWLVTSTWNLVSQEVWPWSKAKLISLTETLMEFQEAMEMSLQVRRTVISCFMVKSSFIAKFTYCWILDYSSMRICHQSVFL